MKSFVSLLLFTSIVLPCSAALKNFVQQPDESYQYTIVKEEKTGANSSYIVDLTSQTWDGAEWKHWVYIITPSKIIHPDKAVLIITGGSVRAKAPGIPSQIRAIAAAVETLGVPVAVVNQIPNQPIFDGLKEDDAIAHTMVRYLESNDPTDILLFPMTKSAVRAMDCVSEVLTDKNIHVDQFILSGASKRGWTTYLSAAVDERVIAIAPMVIDMLDIPTQMKKQKEVYGDELSSEISPYTSRGILEKLDSERGQQLLRLVDPYHYRHLLTMPKLVLLGTNDPYWPLDAANAYFDELGENAYLHYVPNANHDLNLSALPPLLAFFKANLSETALPNFEWSRAEDGSTTILNHEGAQLKLWQASSPSMDFRKAEWSSSPIDDTAAPLTIKPQSPSTGLLGYYVEAVYPAQNGLPQFSLTSQVTILKAE